MVAKIKVLGRIPTKVVEGLSLELDAVLARLSGKNETVNVTLCSSRMILEDYAVGELRKRTNLMEPKFFVSSLPNIFFMPYLPAEICINVEDFSARSETEKRVALAHEMAHALLKEHPPHGTPEFTNNLNRLQLLTKDEEISRECLSRLFNFVGDVRAYELMFKNDHGYRQLALEALADEKKHLDTESLRKRIKMEDLAFSDLVLLLARNVGRASVILALQEFDPELAEEYEIHWFQVVNEVMMDAPIVILAIKKLIKCYRKRKLDIDGVVNDFIEIAREYFRDFNREHIG